MRPVVAITSWRRDLETFWGPDTLMTLSTHYTDSVAGAGMTPLLIPAALDPSEAGPIVGMVDGVLMSGGDDVDPDTYGAENTHSIKTSTDVDQFEIAVALAARDQGKPVLAICRGLQLLNVALGGTLRQEVTSEGGVHDLISRDHEAMGSRRHVVRFEEGSVFAGLYGSAEAKVNTLHHQGIDVLAPDLVAEGRTDDGLIEAVRYDGDWWALGVQWHPERMDGEHQRIFGVFAEVLG
ncbi:MAG TPA: gamma-glutamyl-gamma-aminobutyrate hydrolase family protein [Acidimicrobiia bacterium]|nr:gamma-glutamyl-gamma-aminobutyrate hydrolase family protein [Acidimicrobiia bacterium]